MNPSGSSDIISDSFYLTFITYGYTIIVDMNRQKEGTVWTPVKAALYLAEVARGVCMAPGVRPYFKSKEATK